MKLTSVCCRSMLAKGLRAGVLLAAVPFCSLAGLSGGGVASCGIGLKLLYFVNVRIECVWKGPGVTIREACRDAINAGADGACR